MLDIQTILKKSFFSNTISPRNLVNLADICLTKQVQKKEILFLEGERGFSFYILAEGGIRLFKTAEDGNETVIKIIKPGEMFAEVILFEEEKYPVSAAALTESTVLMIPRHQFTCLLQSEEFRDEFIGGLMRKMRYLAEQMKMLTQLDVEDRFFRFLNEHFGPQTRIRTDLSKKDIASAIFTTPETLSRLLLRLKHEKRLIWQKNLIIRDP